MSTPSPTAVSWPMNWIAILACLLMAIGLRPCAAETANRPNVLLISVDDLNDWIGPLRGHPQTKTPNFDLLAKRGVTFTNAHCNVPICSPSRTSLMTGLQPFRSGVYTNGESVFDLEGKYATLPEHFAAAGYATLGAGKLFHGSGGRYRQFFQEYGPGSGNQGGPFTKEELNTLNQNPVHEVDRGPGKLKATLPLNRMPDVRRTGQPRNNSFDWGPVDVATAEMPDGMVASWARDQLGRDRQRPFFMGVGFYRPHQPLFAPSAYFDPFPATGIVLPETQPRDIEDLPRYAQQLALLPLTAGSHATVVSYGQWEEATASYLACVHFVDELLGSVLDALERSPHADNTWIVLFSDHGYHLGEKQHWGKFTPWREATRVPLMVVPPESVAKRAGAQGKIVTAPVSLIDLYPTLIDVCGLDDPAHELDGRSLRSLVEGAATGEQRTAITTVGRGTYSIRSGNYRYIRYFDGTEELYDVDADPREWRNRAADERLAPVKQQLNEALPRDQHVAHFVRLGDWKAVLHASPEQPPLLFQISPGTGSGGGIGETRSVADQHPEVLQQIRNFLAAHPDAPQRLSIPE